MADAPTTTPGSTPGSGTDTGQQPNPTGGTGAEKTPGADQGQKPDEGKGGKDAVLADLAKERDKRQLLETEVTDLRAKFDALGKALGGESAEASGEADLVARIDEMQKQIEASSREALILKMAAKHKIPETHQHLLTATDTAELETQAKSLGELVAAAAKAAETPPFANNPGQGQESGDPASYDARIADATSKGNHRLAIALKREQQRVKDAQAK